MGVAHHASYFVWFEVGRTDLIRELGTPYKQMEASGIFLPVIEAHALYQKPIHYDDELALHSSIVNLTGLRLRIAYRLHRSKELMATGHTVHTFTGPTGKPIRPSQDILDKLKVSA